MRRALLILCLSTITSLAVGFDRPTGAGFAGRSVVLAPEVMAATSQPLATQVALQIMRDGGNAIDG